jgi:hypothetical protein
LSLLASGLNSSHSKSQHLSSVCHPSSGLAGAQGVLKYKIVISGVSSYLVLLFNQNCYLVWRPGVVLVLPAFAYQHDNILKGENKYNY